jgi:hypothetical protein
VLRRRPPARALVRCESTSAHQHHAAKQCRRTPQGARLVAAALLRVRRRSSAGASAPLFAAAGEAHAEARRTHAAVASLPAMPPPSHAGAQAVLAEKRSGRLRQTF